MHVSFKDFLITGIQVLPLVGLAVIGLQGTLGSEFPASLTARTLYSYSFPSVTFSSSNSQSCQKD